MNTNPALLLIFTALAVLLVAERRGQRAVAAGAKVLASTGFLALAVSHRLLDATPGTVLFVGLVLSFIGDVALLSKEKRPFLIGLGAFLLAHVAYAAAFASADLDVRMTAIAALPMVVVVGLVLRWLMPHVSSSMRLPVVAYALAIGTMVACAAGVLGPRSATVLNGAILFLVSDLFVARERFVQSGFVNRGLGLPLYYAGQVLLIAGMRPG